MSGASAALGGRSIEISYRLSRGIPVLSVLVAFGLLAIGIVMLLDARQDAWDSAERASNNLSIVMTRDIARNISRYDLSIQGAIAALRIPGIATASPELRHAAVFDKATATGLLGSLVVVDAAGNFTMDSQSLTVHAVNVNNREHFAILRDHPNLGLYIGRPVRSRLDDDPIIALSRRVDDADGTFAGAVIGGMRLSYFQDLFAKLDFGRDGSVTLIRADGRIIARYPLHPQDIDLDLSQTPTFRAISAAPSGQFIGLSAADGGRRLFTFRHVGDLPLILAIGYSVDTINASWWHKAIAIGAVMLGLSAATAGLGELFRREMQRRIKAEQSLVVAAGELSTLAITDGLTGLENRRSFDSKLELEWRRAARTAAPLALLMIDADFFKRFNDTYGHPEGDAVLRSIAACIKQNTRRPGDVGARYGGEEFAVVLPDTGSGGAVMVAERIRGAVRDLEIPHQGHPGQRVTISIGVAVRRPQEGQAAADLVHLADKALFEAKQGGRDRVCVAAALEAV